MESRIQTASPPDERHTTGKLIAELKTMFQRAEKKAVERAKFADQVVREHPYPTIGVAFGLGLLLGFLVRRK